MNETGKMTWPLLLSAFFDRLDANALVDFARIMRMEAMRASRNAAQPGLEDDARRDCLATVRICYGIADDAEKALTARTGAANAQSEGGFQTAT